MAVLTWKNVDQPNFGPAVAGQVAATGLMDKAFDALGKGLTNMQADHDKAINSNALASFIRTDDPTAYQNLVQSADLRGLDANTLKAIDTRRTDLLNRAASRQTQDQNEYTYGRQHEENAALDAAKPAFAALLAAGNDPAKLAAVRQQFGPILANLTGDQQFTAANKAQSNARDITSNRSSLFTQNNAETDRGDLMAGRRAAVDAMQTSLNPNDVADSLDRSNLTPSGLLIANALTEPRFGPTYGGLSQPQVTDSPVPGTGAAAALDSAVTGSKPAAGKAPISTTGANFINSIPFNETANYTANVVGNAGEVTGTNAEKAAKLMPHIWNQESGNRQTNPDGSVVQGPVTKNGQRAVGVGQLMPATAREMEKELGMKAGETDTSAEANRRASQAYMEKMLNKFDGDVPKAVAAYNAGPGNVDDWVGSGRSSVGEVRTSINDVAAASGQLASGMGGAAQTLIANYKDTTPASTIAADIAGEGKVLADADPKVVADTISDIATRAQISNKQAAAILLNNPSSVGWFRGLLPNATQGNLSGNSIGGGAGFDKDRVEQAIAEQKAGGTARRAEALAQLDATEASLQSAYKAQETAQQQLNEVVRRAAGNERLKPQIAKYRNRLAQTQLGLSLLLDRQRNQQESNPRYTPAEEPKPVAIPEPPKTAPKGISQERWEMMLQD